MPHPCEANPAINHMQEQGHDMGPPGGGGGNLDMKRTGMLVRNFDIPTYCFLGRGLNCFNPYEVPILKHLLSYYLVSRSFCCGPFEVENLTLKAPEKHCTFLK